MPIVDHNGNRLYYEDSGGAGPAIVFSHGAFLDHTIWDLVVERLAPAHRCITWDARGHGMSEANGPFTYWDLAGDVMAILDDAGIESAVLVGMSQGGWLTQRAALATPDRVRGIVLTATSLPPLSAEEQTGYRQLAGAWVAMGPVGDIANTLLGFQFLPTTYDGSRFIGKWQSRPPALWAEVWETIFNRDDIVDRFGDIKCPGLVVHGTGDQIFSLASAEEMGSMLPASQGIVVIDGGPHCAALTHPDELSSAVAGFVAGL